MSSRPIVIVDVETTGLRDHHVPFEVSFLEYGGLTSHPKTFYNSLSSMEIAKADPKALEINGWSTNELIYDLPKMAQETMPIRQEFLHVVTGATLMGANVRFDAEMLRKIIGMPMELWHHRLFDIQAYYAGHFRLPGLIGLNDMYEELDSLYPGTIAKPDHTAANDVRCVRDIYTTLLRR